MSHLALNPHHLTLGLQDWGGRDLLAHRVQAQPQSHGQREPCRAEAGAGGAGDWHGPLLGTPVQVQRVLRSGKTPPSGWLEKITSQTSGEHDLPMGIWSSKDTNEWSHIVGAGPSLGERNQPGSQPRDPHSSVSPGAVLSFLRDSPCPPLTLRPPHPTKPPLVDFLSKPIAPVFPKTLTPETRSPSVRTSST